MMTRTITRVLGLFLLLLGCHQLGWGAGISVVGGLTREATLRPGERSEGTIVVRNTTSQLAQVKVYQNDYLFQSDGTNIFGDPGSAPRSNASWISFAPQLLEIPPGATANLSYLVSVPQDESLVGTYWSVLMIEPVNTNSMDPERLKQGEVSISTVMRYAVQMVTHIGDTGRTELRFTDRKLERRPDGYTLVLDAGNPGERSLRPSFWVEIFTSEGENIGRFEGERSRIYPGCSVRLQLRLPLLSAGKYTALVLGDDGGTSVFGARYELVIQ